MNFEQWWSQWLSFLTPPNFIRIAFVFIVILVFWMTMKLLIAREKNRAGAVIPG